MFIIITLSMAESIHCTFCKSTNHTVKNADNVTICPLLLSTQCKFCKDKGHTIRNCTKLKKPYNPNHTQKRRMDNEEDKIISNMYNKYGEFWPLIVENTVNDNYIAHRIRNSFKSSKLRKDFTDFLHRKYHDNWLYKSKYSNYDCTYLDYLRDQNSEHEQEIYKRRRLMTHSYDDRYTAYNEPTLSTYSPNDYMPDDYVQYDTMSYKRKF